MGKPFYQCPQNRDEPCSHTEQEKYGIAFIVASSNFRTDIEIIGKEYKN